MHSLLVLWSWDPLFNHHSLFQFRCQEDYQTLARTEELFAVRSAVKVAKLVKFRVTRLLHVGPDILLAVGARWIGHTSTL